MREIRKANVILAKCCRSHQTYGIRVEQRADNVWYCTWAFPISDKNAKSEGYDNVVISGRVENDPEYPGCPYCGNRAWVNCDRCKKLTCWDGREGVIECEWCRNKGEIIEAETFDISAGDY